MKIGRNSFVPAAVLALGLLTISGSGCGSPATMTGTGGTASGTGGTKASGDGGQNGDGGSTAADGSATGADGSATGADGSATGADGSTATTADMAHVVSAADLTMTTTTADLTMSTTAADMVGAASTRDLNMVGSAPIDMAVASTSVDLVATSGCVAAADPCAVDSDCCSGSCDPGSATCTGGTSSGDMATSSCMAVGSSCSQDSDCCTGTSCFLQACVDNTGLRCAQDSDCGRGLTCILPTANDPLFGGGPANGYCSATCTTDTDCTASSVCLLPTTGPGKCVLACNIGPALMYINDPIAQDGKCNTRDDVACAPINMAGTELGCVPACGSDSQCPTGRHCDPSLGVCVDAPTGGDPTGAACDPNATSPTCAGTCVNFGTTSICSSECVLGGDTTLLNNPNCGGLTHGLCAFSPQANGAGDSGFCSPACAKQSDCAQFPTFACVPIGGLSFISGGVPNGYCFGGPTACPNGASDCTSVAGTMCTATSAGPLCLSPMIPLGNEGPDAGTGNPVDAGETPDGG